jgi:hypothetical protein
LQRDELKARRRRTLAQQVTPAQHSVGVNVKTGKAATRPSSTPKAQAPTFDQDLLMQAILAMKAKKDTQNKP